MIKALHYSGLTYLRKTNAFAILTWFRIVFIIRTLFWTNGSIMIIKALTYIFQSWMLAQACQKTFGKLG